MEVESEARLTLRMPRDLRRRIEAAAKVERRSVVAQIVRKLEEAYPENEKAEAAAGVATPA